jgi:hypothetical protein
MVCIVVLVATFQLGRLGDALTARGFLWLLSGWTVLCAVLSAPARGATRTTPWGAMRLPSRRAIGVRRGRFCPFEEI